LNLTQDEVDVEKYIAAKAICATATCQDLAEFGFPEDEATYKTAENQLRWRTRFGISGKIDSGKPFTFKDHFADPISRASDSPFDELDEKLPEKEKVKKLIDYVREGSKIKFPHELADRLNFLNEAVNEDPDEVPISIESWRNFISFLQNTTNLKYPNIVLTPSNEISAQWRTAPNRHFAVVFLPTGEARFVIFTPNPKDPDKIDRFSGITSVDSLIERIRPYKILEWASQ